MLLIGCVVLAGFLQTFCLLFGLHWLLTREKREIEDRLHALSVEWFTPCAEGEAHKAAEVMGRIGEIVGASAARSIMASLSAEKSHVARVANGMSDELQGAQNPLLGLLAGGKRGKGAAVAQLASLLGPMLSGGASNNGGKNASEYTGRRHRD